LYLQLSFSSILESNKDICVTLLSRRLEYQGRLVLLERSVGVFRQCKQSLDNKSLQLVSMIEGNLIDELNTIHKGVAFRSYIHNRSVELLDQYSDPNNLLIFWISSLSGSVLLISLIHWSSHMILPWQAVTRILWRALRCSQ